MWCLNLWVRIKVKVKSRAFPLVCPILKGVFWKRNVKWNWWKVNQGWWVWFIPSVIWNWLDLPGTVLSPKSITVKQHPFHRAVRLNLWKLSVFFFWGVILSLFYQVTGRLHIVVSACQFRTVIWTQFSSDRAALGLQIPLGLHIAIEKIVVSCPKNKQPFKACLLN